MKLLNPLLLVLVLLACMLVTGCKPEQLEDGYQPGDLTRIGLQKAEQIIRWRNSWCHQGNQYSREQLITLIRIYQPEYPVKGICDDQLLVQNMLSIMMQIDRRQLLLLMPALTPSTFREVNNDNTSTD